jgi:hypothetical protein
MAGVPINVEVLTSDKKDKRQVELPECWICGDSGMVIYNKKTEMGEYEYVAHCTCPAGVKYQYDGRQCKVKSDYYIPSIAEVCDPETIAKENLTDFYERNKSNEDVIQALKDKLKAKKAKGGLQ